MGIYGFVKNRTDGSVYIEADGETEILEQFIIWLRKGPSWSRVEEIKVNDIPFNNYKCFVVK
jgi:acylphosphatase